MSKDKNQHLPQKPYDPEDDILLDAYATAKFIGGEQKPLSVGTLAVWRCTGRYDLPYLKIGRLVRYRQSDARKFRDQRRQSPN